MWPELIPTPHSPNTWFPRSILKWPNRISELRNSLWPRGRRRRISSTLSTTVSRWTKPSLYQESFWHELRNSIKWVGGMVWHWAQEVNFQFSKPPLVTEFLFSKRTCMHIPVWHIPDLKWSLEDWESHVLNHNGLWWRVYRKFSPSNLPKLEYINTYFKRTCFSIGRVTIRGSRLNSTWMKRSWLWSTVFP